MGRGWYVCVSSLKKQFLDYWEDTQSLGLDWSQHEDSSSPGLCKNSSQNFDTGLALSGHFGLVAGLTTLVHWHSIWAECGLSSYSSTCHRPTAHSMYAHKNSRWKSWDLSLSPLFLCVCVWGGGQVTVGKFCCSWKRGS